LWSAVVVGLSASTSHGADPKGTILYFDPDANHQAIVQIAVLFNEYLSRQGSGLSFQPVSDPKLFESLIGSSETRYAIVTPEYSVGPNGPALYPLLAPMRRGDRFYTKVLVDLGSDPDGDLSGQIILATGRAESAAQILEMLANGGIRVRGAQVTLVSTDVNAIRGVVYRQAKAALVTQDNIDVLLEAYDAQNRPKLRRLFETPPIPRPALCAVGTAASDDPIVALFTNMITDPIGRRVMAQLRIDGWVPYDRRSEAER
jgi:ABC-type phosphate/phosphonate transport system substrate-binding protein